MPKLSELTEITTLTGDDEVIATNDPLGTPATRRISVANLRTSLGWIPLATNVTALEIPTDMNTFSTSGRAAIGDRGAAHYARQTVTTVANVASLPGTGSTGTVYYATTEGTYHRWLSDHYLIDRSMNGALLSSDGSHFRCIGRDADGLTFCPEMFGSVSADADSASVIQDAVDRAIAVNRLDDDAVGQCLFLAGYRIDEPIRVFEWDETDGEHLSGKFTVKLSGINRGYIGDRQPGLLCNFTDGPGLVIAATRSTVVENMTIVGTTVNLTTGNSVEDILKDDGATPWWDPSGTLRDERYTPFCGIAIDPFATSTPPEGAYPDLTTYYGTSADNETSRLVTIDNCKVQNFIVGVMVSPTQTEQLGDTITIRNLNADNNKVAIGCGQDQNRGIYVENIHAVGVQTLIDTVQYGDTTGVAPVVTGGVVAYCKQLFNVDVARGLLDVRGLYAELTHSLGAINGQFGATFTNCHVKMVRPRANSAQGAINAMMALKAGTMTFVGGYYGYFASVADPIYIYNPTGQQMFLGTCFDAPPIFHTPRNVHIDSVMWRYSHGGDYPAVRQNFLVADIADVGDNSYRYHIPPGGRLVDTDNSNIYENLEGYQYDQIESVSFTINGTAGTGTFTASDAGAYQVGDMLVTAEPPITFELGPGQTDLSVRTYFMGVVSGIAGSTITLSGVPYGLVTDSDYRPAHYRLGEVRTPSTGDTTSSSNSITNVTNTGTWEIGSWIKGAGIPAGTRVTNVSGSTLTISQNATATATGVDLYDANLTVTAF